RGTQRGTARDSGGAFETTLLVLWVFGADGLATRQETFPSDREAEALARFDELTAAPSRAARRRGRAVRPNAATPNAAAIGAGTAARDPRALAQIDRLLGDGAESVDNTNGTTVDRRGSLAIWRAFMQVPDLTPRYEPLATLGDSLAVFRYSV